MAKQACCVKSLVRQGGFTLVELLVTVVLAAILSLAGIPAYKNMIQKVRLSTSMNELSTSFNYARSEAVKRGAPVMVSADLPPDIGAQPSYPWERGWIVFVDMDGDRMMGDGDTLLYSHGPLHKGFTLRSSPSSAGRSFTYTGPGNNATGAPVTFVLCDTAAPGGSTPAPGTSRMAVVKPSGVVSSGMDADGDGIPEGADGANIHSCNPPFQH